MSVKKWSRQQRKREEKARKEEKRKNSVEDYRQREAERERQYQAKQEREEKMIGDLATVLEGLAAFVKGDARIIPSPGGGYKFRRD